MRLVIHILYRIWPFEFVQWNRYKNVFYYQWLLGYIAYITCADKSNNRLHGIERRVGSTIPGTNLMIRNPTRRLIYWISHNSRSCQISATQKPSTSRYAGNCAVVQHNPGWIVITMAIVALPMQFKRSHHRSVRINFDDFIFGLLWSCVEMKSKSVGSSIVR